MEKNLIGVWLSLARALGLGPRGPEFESLYPNLRDRGVVPCWAHNPKTMVRIHLPQLNMKSVADLVMHRIVVPEYAGSIPVWLPKFWLKRLGEKSMVKTRLKKISRINSAGRVRLLQSRSRRFEPYIRDSRRDS